jgi:hypothetical protein
MAGVGREKAYLNRSITGVFYFYCPSLSADVELYLLLSTDDRASQISFGYLGYGESFFTGDRQERAVQGVFHCCISWGLKV